MDTDINYIILESIKGNKKSQEILLNKLHPLIYKNIYKYYKSDDIIVEDLVQEGYMVILKSLETYNEKQDVRFLGYVKTKLVFFYKNYYRDTKNQRETISLNQKLLNWNNGIEIEDRIAEEIIDPIDKIFKEDEINELLTNIEKLTKKEQNVLNMYYWDNLSMFEISNELHIAYRTVIWRKYSAIQKLKKLMGGEENG